MLRMTLPGLLGESGDQVFDQDGNVLRALRSGGRRNGKTLSR